MHDISGLNVRFSCFSSSVYIGDETADNEPDFQYTPDTYHISTTLPPGGDPLSGSLTLLQEGLESGAALAQFEVRASSSSSLRRAVCLLCALAG